jgi:hypothetical protein
MDASDGGSGGGGGANGAPGAVAMAVFYLKRRRETLVFGSERERKKQ